MSFDIQSARFYGTGVLGDVTNPTGQLSSYASVTAISTNPKTITIDLTNASAGAYEQFAADTEIMLHISGIRSGGNVLYLGRYKFAKIVSVADNVLTLDAKPLDLDPTKYLYQVISVPQFKSLTLSNTISPPAFDETKGHGGVLIIKCSSKLTLTGSISLVDKGLATDTYRPLLNQEEGGILDTDTYSGYENYETAKHFALNVGDGAAMILAKSIDFDDTARIGNPLTKGIQRCRGTSDSIGAPSGVTNIGGSSILIVAETIKDFCADVIAKYRNSSLTAGKGLCRAYIATESSLPCDEGLYAYDVINTPERLYNDTLINVSNGFGSGVSSNARAPLLQQNNYAKVTKISGNSFTVSGLTTNGYAQFETGALVMVHASTKKASAVKSSGRFFLANIVGIKKASSTWVLTLNHSIDELGLSNFTVDNYNFQVVSIPQYNNFTLSGTNNTTPKYDNGQGGIFAIAVSDTCDLSDGFIDVRGVGGNKYTLDYVSNARMKNRLPIGAGHGSVFILAKNLKMNTSTRIGADYSGNAFGGNVGGSSTNYGGGYSGRGYDKSQGGSGQQGGKESNGHNGGFCSNASNFTRVNIYSGLQGASIFIVAQKIDGLSLNALSTGGCAGSTGHVIGSKYKCVAGTDGGCGYGGGGASLKYTPLNWLEYQGTGGGVHGGGAGCSAYNDAKYMHGGGASGFAFIYCNGYVSQSTSNLVFN